MATQLDLWFAIAGLTNSNQEFTRIVVEIETRDAEVKAIRKAHQLLTAMGHEDLNGVEKIRGKKRKSLRSKAAVKEIPDITCHKEGNAHVYVERKKA